MSSVNSNGFKTEERYHSLYRTQDWGRVTYLSLEVQLEKIKTDIYLTL